MRRGVYPGTFDPPTIGHLAVVEAALDQRRLDRLDLVVSRRPLAKDVPVRPSLHERLEVIEASVAHLGVVAVVVTDLRLIADIAEGYDVVVMGADKWHQVNDAGFYRSHAHRDDALARLPEIAVAGRDGIDVEPRLRLHVPDHVNTVSATAARDGRHAWMTPAARESGHWGEPS